MRQNDGNLVAAPVLPQLRVQLVRFLTPPYVGVEGDDTPIFWGVNLEYESFLKVCSILLPSKQLRQAGGTHSHPGSSGVGPLCSDRRRQDQAISKND